MKVYICGKVTGEDPLFCSMKFKQHAYHLRELGHEVINPMELVPVGVDWKLAMIICIRELITCDAISPLADTLNSKGAMLEWSIAQQLGLHIIMPLYETIKK